MAFRCQCHFEGIEGHIRGGLRRSSDPRVRKSTSTVLTRLLITGILCLDLGGFFLPAPSQNELQGGKCLGFGSK
ncbi:hypothetical protein L873DRAFT_1809848 [Choiromyces venosus 120613-1]|uniref:Uncharacterized protein n=1 Tax=Choiromyces venosus 120613-1 TaxID=1336337 RepID=A0A3N4JGD4_9PEZI|nr:hypothetical protein L873DRAFT_1809848 [Choiromyces venosus 120613-1]